MVFMVVPLMKPEQLAQFQQHYVHAYEYMDKAGQRSYNGLPIFLSVRGLTQGEWNTMSGYARELLAQRDAFLKGDAAP
jgi:hypothetical protein